MIRHRLYSTITCHISSERAGDEVLGGLISSDNVAGLDILHLVLHTLHVSRQLYDLLVHVLNALSSFGSQAVDFSVDRVYIITKA